MTKEPISSAHKRARLSYCEAEFLEKLTHTIHTLFHTHSQPNHHPTDTAHTTPSTLRDNLLALLTYGTDVNINLPSHVLPSTTPTTTLHLTSCAGDVNCDLENDPLHHHTRIHQGNTLVRLLCSVGLDINCPHIAGGLDPLLLEEARHRVTILRALVTGGSDTNGIRGALLDHRCHFCDNLQFLHTFGELQQQEEGDSSLVRGVVYKALLAMGDEVNSVRCKRGPLLCPHESATTNPHALAELLVTNGHKVNCFPPQDTTSTLHLLSF